MDEDDDEFDEVLHVLPARCHVVVPGLPAGRNVAVCERGVGGVRLLTLDLGTGPRAWRIVRAFNDSLGIDEGAERAMLAGCLLGWRVAAVWLRRRARQTATEAEAPRTLH